MNYDSVGWYHPVENGFRHGYLMGHSSTGFAQETHVYLDDFKESLQDPHQWAVPRNEQRRIFFLNG